MSEAFFSRLGAELIDLKNQGNFRQLPKFTGDKMSSINLSSNDYLGIARDTALRSAFLERINPELALLSASSSRLLCGNYPIYKELEDLLSDYYNSEAALVFNSGYHTNIGILPALANSNILLLVDKLVHASLIDGLKLTKARCIRYRHLDYEQLEYLVSAYSNDFETVIIVTESIFSMDGDMADLARLVAIKKSQSNLLLYVDEAHAVGVFGANGLGLAEEKGCVLEIDFLVGTFGKALGSIGGYLICKEVVRAFLINKMRPLLYTTGLPPINLLWSKFVLEKMISLNNRRKYLAALSDALRTGLGKKCYACSSNSHIVPLIIGDSETVINKVSELEKKGFLLSAIRSPTVAKGTERIRISLNSNLSYSDIDNLLRLL